MEVTIAVLLTCHNRKDKTLQCLEAFVQSSFCLPHVRFAIFLVDDGSTDGTSAEVKKRFPEVNVIEGNGSLFWNQGMRLAWKTAADQNAYDYYLWLNDDTLLLEHALVEMMAIANEVSSATPLFLICGACKASENETIFSYGGRVDSGVVMPNGAIEKCRYINGNCVLVPSRLFERIGVLSMDYTHGIGDNDYGLRAIEAGGYCYTTKTYIAVCPPNPGVPAWCNPKVSLRNRWKSFHSPVGLNIKEYNIYRKRFWGNRWRVFALKAYLKLLFPKLYGFMGKKSIQV